MSLDTIKQKSALWQAPTASFSTGYSALSGILGNIGGMVGSVVAGINTIFRSMAILNLAVQSAQGAVYHTVTALNDAFDMEITWENSLSTIQTDKAEQRVTAVTTQAVQPAQGVVSSITQLASDLAGWLQNAFTWLGKYASLSGLIQGAHESWPESTKWVEDQWEALGLPSSGNIDHFFGILGELYLAYDSIEQALMAFEILGFTDFSCFQHADIDIDPEAKTSAKSYKPAASKAPVVHPSKKLQFKPHHESDDCLTITTPKAEQAELWSTKLVKNQTIVKDRLLETQTFGLDLDDGKIEWKFDQEVDELPDKPLIVVADRDYLIEHPHLRYV